jgi:hypothetical protein
MHAGPFVYSRNSVAQPTFQQNNNWITEDDDDTADDEEEEEARDEPVNNLHASRPSCIFAEFCNATCISAEQQLDNRLLHKPNLTTQGLPPQYSIHEPSNGRLLRHIQQQLRAVLRMQGIFLDSAMLLRHCKASAFTCPQCGNFVSYSCGPYEGTRSSSVKSAET